MFHIANLTKITLKLGKFTVNSFMGSDITLLRIKNAATLRVYLTYLDSEVHNFEIQNPSRVSVEQIVRNLRFNADRKLNSGSPFVQIELIFKSIKEKSV